MMNVGTAKIRANIIAEKNTIPKEKLAEPLNTPNKNMETNTIILTVFVFAILKLPSYLSVL